ncbi:unnamed protein product [Psylliodes chrysocephalus]|uniref:Uncharacterized protein n=1 Tax=Psylliodes chrysocephalus TaxID=3402493 RepID=A0A9P0GDJ8_9CUCU|nr:unnamed protein product [Psylliodes chrysocephala]
MKKSSKLSNGQEKENSSYKKLKNTEFEISNNTKRGNFFNIFDYIFIIAFLLILLSNIFSFGAISWQLSSFGRVFLIKILPYYDWRPLKNEQCLIKRPFSDTERTRSNLNCDLCEDTFEIDAHKSLEEDILEERYINIDVPVILTTGVEKWPKDSKFMIDIQNDSSFVKSYPCGLSTNINKGVADVGTILSKQIYFDHFFIHFQNCELEAMRTLRKYIYRPDFLPSAYSPTLYNWLIWNENYNTTNYKHVDLVEKVAIVGQLFGTTSFRLKPRKNCANVCTDLTFNLHGGEILIFTSLWDLEYRPNDIGENMAVIMEY